MIISKKKLLLLPRLLSLVSSENNSVSVCLIVLHRSKRRHLMPFLGFLNTNSPPIKNPKTFSWYKRIERVHERRQKQMNFIIFSSSHHFQSYLKINFFISNSNKGSRTLSLSSWGVLCGCSKKRGLMSINKELERESEGREKVKGFMELWCLKVIV